MKKNSCLILDKIKIHISSKSIAFTAGIYVTTCLLCALLRNLGNDNNYVSMIFILSIFMTARFTDGYWYGIIASLVGVLTVNYFFTFPFFAFNFTLAGYPLTILSMLAVSIATSALTTQTKQSEQIKMEVEKEKTRSNLLRAVSHDLRTPLTSILGAISVMIENDGSLTGKERMELLCGAQDDAQWLIRVVENLLAVTRIDEESRAKIIKAPEAAEEIVSEVVAKFKKRFPDQNLQVKVPDELLLIPMDAILIEQVLMNLLENAVIHGKGEDCIQLSVTLKGNKAAFEVRDNGAGIDPEKLPKIFDGYLNRATEDESDSKRNMGIGLSVCNTIIRAHGGKMYAANNLDGGASFRFELNMMENEHG